jgi:hypothetical protein
MSEVQVTASEKSFRDAGEQDDQGFYEYYYSGLDLEVHSGGVIYLVRRYDDDPTTATFYKAIVRGESRSRIDRNAAEFKAAVEFLASKYKIEQVSLYDCNKGFYQTIKNADLSW